MLAAALYCPQAASADDVPRDYVCQPARSVFCGNIHVGCAGATDIPTASFRVSIMGAIARVDFEGAEPSVRGRVDESGDVVIRLENSRAWIRIQQDGRYSHRIYWRGGAAMSHGTCRRTPVL
jgi:hypothetical protein